MLDAVFHREGGDNPCERWIGPPALAKCLKFSVTAPNGHPTISNDPRPASNNRPRISNKPLSGPYLSSSSRLLKRERDIGREAGAGIQRSKKCAKKRPTIRGPENGVLLEDEPSKNNGLR